MGGDIMFKVMRRTRSKGTARLVLMAICSWADADGLAYPSLRQLERAANCSRSSVKRAIRELTAAGELRVHSRGHTYFDPIKHKTPPPGGFQATNYYEIVFAQPLAGQAKVISTGRAKLAPPCAVKGGSTVAPKVGPNTTATPYAMQVTASHEEVEQGAGAPDRSLTEGESVRLMTTIAHAVLDREPDIDWGSLAEDIKCAAARLPELRGRYTGVQVRKAIESALFQRNGRKTGSG